MYIMFVMLVMIAVVMDELSVCTAL